MTSRGRGRLYAALVVVATLIGAAFVARDVRLDPDIAALLPDRGAASALARYARAFGGGDPGLVLVEGPNADEVGEATRELVDATRARPTLGRAYASVELAADLRPSAWFLVAGADRFDALARALTPAGMRDRLRESRALLLAPGGSLLGPQLARDPLRLAQLATEGRAAPINQPVRSDGELASDDGRARLVVIEPLGNALKSSDAQAFVREVDAVLAATRARHPAVSLRLTGGHAIAAATEGYLRRDIVVSSVLALVLASLAFVAFFRVPRALLAVVPPLAAGAVLTTAVAAAFAHGLSAIATAFASVVLGVGMDSGVHLYAAVRRSLAAGSADPAGDARAGVARPVLGAALVAASAFACLALSEVVAVRQLGILSAAGEITTALTIVAVTPQLAEWLERHRKRPPTVERAPAWSLLVARMTHSPRARRAIVVAWCVPLVLLAVFGPPKVLVGLTSVRPEGLAPLTTYDDLAKRFGFASTAPLVVITSDRDDAAARLRADSLADALRSRPDVVASVDALGAWAPSKRTIEVRRARRDALDLPARAAELETALGEAGLATKRFASAIDDLRAPARDVDVSAIERVLGPRYVARLGDETLVATYVQPVDGHDEDLARLVASLDATAQLTGYPMLEPALRASLAADLPRAGGLALLLLVASLALTLRRPREVAIAALVVACEIVTVLALMRAFGVPLHVYNALVLPVLVGITIDEVLFVLFATRERDVAEAVAHEAPVVMATALTTAAGFAALIACRFAALRQIGFVGAVGSATGVLLAVTLVPALVARRASNEPKPGH